MIKIIYIQDNLVYKSNYIYGHFKQTFPKPIGFGNMWSILLLWWLTFLQPKVYPINIHGHVM